MSDKRVSFFPYAPVSYPSYEDSDQETVRGKTPPDSSQGSTGVQGSHRRPDWASPRRPRIKQINAYEFVEQAGTLESDVMEWAQSKKKEISKEEKSFLNETMYHLALINDEVQGLDEYILCSRMKNGKPIGLLAIKFQDEMFFRHLMAFHPDHPELKIELMVHAVNLSNSTICGGKLELIADNSTRRFFEKLGFRKSEGFEEAESYYMELDPSQHPDKWTKDTGTGHWRFIGDI